MATKITTETTANEIRVFAKSSQSKKADCGGFLSLLSSDQVPP